MEKIAAEVLPPLDAHCVELGNGQNEKRPGGKSCDALGVAGASRFSESASRINGRQAKAVAKYLALTLGAVDAPGLRTELPLVFQI
jgi:hypothetical protein